jgi:hypothetical protein
LNVGALRCLGFAGAFGSGAHNYPGYINVLALRLWRSTRLLLEVGLKLPAPADWLLASLDAMLLSAVTSH